jgi:hypothetical protein
MKTVNIDIHIIIFFNNSALEVIADEDSIFVLICLFYMNIKKKIYYITY